MLLFWLITQWSFPRVRAAEVKKLVGTVHPVVVQLQRLRLLLLLLDQVGTVEHVEVVDVEAGRGVLLIVAMVVPLVVPTPILLVPQVVQRPHGTQPCKTKISLLLFQLGLLLPLLFCTYSLLLLTNPLLLLPDPFLFLLLSSALFSSSSLFLPFPSLVFLPDLLLLPPDPVLLFSPPPFLLFSLKALLLLPNSLLLSSPRLLLSYPLLLSPLLCYPPLPLFPLLLLQPPSLYLSLCLPFCLSPQLPFSSLNFSPVKVLGTTLRSSLREGALSLRAVLVGVALGRGLLVVLEGWECRLGGG